jgi:hypothetical protein
VAEHFEEILQIRLQALEARVEDDAMGTERHFKELQDFWTQNLDKSTAALRGELSEDIDQSRTGLQAEIRQVRSDLETKMDGTRADLHRFERKMETQLETIHLLLQDVLRRRPL